MCIAPEHTPYMPVPCISLMQTLLVASLSTCAGRGSPTAPGGSYWHPALYHDRSRRGLEPPPGTRLRSGRRRTSAISPSAPIVLTGTIADPDGALIPGIPAPTAATP